MDTLLSVTSPASLPWLKIFSQVSRISPALLSIFLSISWPVLFNTTSLFNRRILTLLITQKKMFISEWINSIAAPVSMATNTRELRKGSTCGTRTGCFQQYKQISKRITWLTIHVVFMYVVMTKLTLSNKNKTRRLRMRSRKAKMRRMPLMMKKSNLLRSPRQMGIVMKSISLSNQILRAALRCCELLINF